MRICLIAEGCYPYVVGGVSSWLHSVIRTYPNQEFIILSIIANRSMSGKFAYELPSNVTEVHELYLEDEDWTPANRHHHSRLEKKEYQALRSLVLDQDVDWNTVFDMFQNHRLSLNQVLMGEDFYHAVLDCYNLRYPEIVFSDFLWTMRSMYLPLFLALSMEIPKADIYHCVSTGYAGILGSMGKYFNHGKLIISEHGIYTREREEELIKAKWVQGVYKKIWIRQFKKMSQIAYDRADIVTSLYEHARELQIELGCDRKKTIVTPNGIDYKRFENIAGRLPEDEGIVNIGAVLRVTPIKDVKTMIQAFAYAKEKQENLKLWIMGPWDEDKEYAEECFELVKSLGVSDVIFTGRIQVTDYLGRMDATILTSISEGQPLTILESFAAHVPVIATDVGNCKGLLYGEDDDFGAAGILTHIMNIEEIADAMIYMAQNPTQKKKMGENGYKRLLKKYKIEDMKATYEGIYKKAGEELGLSWSTENFVPVKAKRQEKRRGFRAFFNKNFHKKEKEKRG